MRLRTLIAILATAAAVGCGNGDLDQSSPQATLTSLRQALEAGRSDQMPQLIHIEARDIQFDDGVTEASAVQNVIGKASSMLVRLHGVASRLRDRFPDDVQRELQAATAEAPLEDRGGLARFLADPLGLLDEDVMRLTAEDLGDGTAAVLLDGRPVLGFGLQMRSFNGQWRLEIPIDLLQTHRPETRHDWAVVASMMLAIENALEAFDTELDDDRFASLRQAADRAGRLLGERVLVQVMIYDAMKRRGAPPRR